ncbi:MAG: UDP-N-acetylmuramoyl-L-alanine--D-glutamate ligase, partial [Gammaproteobacteria bacterium]
MAAATTTLIDAMKEQIRKYDAVIIGLGKTGLSCVRFLAGQGISIAVIDSRNEPPELESLKQHYPDIPLYTGQFNQSLLESAGLLVISPGVSREEPAIKNAVANGVELVGDIELFARHAKAPVIAITGSNGKSTVASLVNHMINESGLKADLGGNIGTSALSLLEKDSPDFYVLELSSFQLETVKSLDAIAAVVLNISVDHMDRYEGIEEYAFAKQNVYAGTGTMIINDDDVRVAAMTLPGRRAIHYSLASPKEGAFGTRTMNDMTWLCEGEELLLPIPELKLKGSHNVSNVLAALAL